MTAFGYADVPARRPRESVERDYNRTRCLHHVRCIRQLGETDRRRRWTLLWSWCYEQTRPISRVLLLC